MVRRPTQPSIRTLAAAVAALTLVGVGLTAAPAAGGQPISRTAISELALTPSKASGVPFTVSTSPLDVVSSTGHRLRLQVVASRSDSGSQVRVQLVTRNGEEEHDWTFNVPKSAITVSKSGTGRIRLTSKRSSGRATVVLHTRPHGGATSSTCHGKTVTRTRHLTVSGRVLLRTRTHGKHAWGKAGKAHKTLHFSVRSRLVRTLDTASDCVTPEFPCRDSVAWQASGGPPGELDFFVGLNKGTHARIEGFRSVPLTDPAGATRTDVVLQKQRSPNQLIVADDHSATLQASFHGRTATLTSPQPPMSETQPCGRSGKKKVSIDSWPADFANGAEPIRLPAQVFGDIAVPDSPAAAIYRVRLKH